MTKLDNEVLEVYTGISTLPAELQSIALRDWWDSLKQNCSKENPCVECRREIESHMSADGD